MSRVKPGGEGHRRGMTEGEREPEAVAPDAVSLEELHRQLDERDRIAHDREQIADERDRIADVREWQLAEGRAPEPGDVPRWRREVLKREREALERALARVRRRDARLDRETPSGIEGGLRSNTR